jgi:16S rRNA processing protein RimM
MITAGKISGSYGLKGQIKVIIYLEDFELLNRIKTFYIGKAHSRTTIDFLRNTKKSTWIAAIPEVKTKEQSDQLKGHLIYFENKYLPTLTIDEYYYEELKGLNIKIDGNMLKGFVKDIHNFGSGDVLEISFEDTQPTRYIPFNKDNVSKIDMANRTIILTPLKGLLS